MLYACSSSSGLNSIAFVYSSMAWSKSRAAKCLCYEGRSGIRGLCLSAAGGDARVALGRNVCVVAHCARFALERAHARIVLKANHSCGGDVRLLWLSISVSMCAAVRCFVLRSAQLFLSHRWMFLGTTSATLVARPFLKPWNRTRTLRSWFWAATTSPRPSLSRS